MSNMNHAAFAQGGIQELSFEQIDAVNGAAGDWEDLGPAVAGGMVGGAVTGAIVGAATGGPGGAGLGATAGAIGGGVGAVVEWLFSEPSDD